jgi:hypothetical protein
MPRVRTSGSRDRSTRSRKFGGSMPYPPCRYCKSTEWPPANLSRHEEECEQNPKNQAPKDKKAP